MPLNPLSSENLVGIANSMGEVRTDPFRMPDYHEILPDFASVAMLPLKLSLYANTIRSTYHMSKSPFEINRRYQRRSMVHGYRATTVDGLLGKALYGIQTTATRLYRGEAFTFGKTKDIARSAKAIKDSFTKGTRDNVFKSLQKFRETLKAPNRHVTPIKPWKHIYTKEGEVEYLRAMGIWKYGSLDKFYVSPKNINRGLQRLLDSGHISSDVYNALTENDELAKKITREIVDITGGPFPTETRPMPSEIWPDIKARRTAWGGERPRTTRELREFYDRSVKEFKRTSIADIVRGIEPGKPVEGRHILSKERLAARKRMLFGKDAIRLTGNDMAQRRLVSTRAVLKHNKALYGRAYGTATEATLRAAQETGLASVQDYKLLQNFAKDVGDNYAGRVAMAKRLKAGAMAAFLIPQGLKAAVWGIRKSEELITRLAPTVKGLFRTEFGNEMDVLSNARLATERQRAVAAIQNAHMNARYLMGNEAPMYH